MTVREAEHDAAHVLSSSWWVSKAENDPLPVDPLEIARELGIKVRYASLPSDESGKITIAPTEDPVIELNRHDSRNRQRFTCAHEIGHYYRRLSQRRLSEHKVFVDRRAELARAGEDPDEIYANQFAAALLMPAKLVQVGWEWEGEPIARLAARFGTSEQAMTLRLQNLGYSVGNPSVFRRY